MSFFGERTQFTLMVPYSHRERQDYDYGEGKHISTWQWSNTWDMNIREPQNKM